MKPLALAAAATVAALAVPAVAAAHPSVYTSSARTYTGTPPTLKTITRYVVVNHGNTIVLTESNGLAANQGVVAFNMVPSGAFRNSLNSEQILQEGGSGAQAHATCLGGTADLGNAAKVTAWQGGNQPAPTTQQPFWNYVPFQTTSASLDDDPADWTPVLVVAGFNLADLATAASAQTACEAKGGTYRAADTTTTSAAALATGQTAPLQTQITDLTAAKTALTEANTKLTDEKTKLTDENTALKDQVATIVSPNTTLTSQVTTLSAELAAAKSQIAALTLAAAPIKLTVSSAKAKDGAKVLVSAAPLRPVTVTLTVSEAQARKLKLASTVIGKQTATTAADGTATIAVKVKKAASKAVGFTAQAVSGDRFATATSKLAR